MSPHPHPQFPQHKRIRHWCLVTSVLSSLPDYELAAAEPHQSSPSSWLRPLLASPHREQIIRTYRFFICLDKWGVGDRWMTLFTNDGDTAEHRSHRYISHQWLPALSLSFSLPLTHTHTHTRTQRKGRLMSPLATGLGNLPNSSRLIESPLAEAIATGRNQVWPPVIICAYCQPGIHLWAKMTCEQNQVQHIYVCCLCGSSRTTSQIVFNLNKFTTSLYRYNNYNIKIDRNFLHCWVTLT